MQFVDLILEEYSSLSLVVYGNTKDYKEDLKKLGGKYNPNLKKGAGWIFSKKFESEIRKWIEEVDIIEKETKKELLRKNHIESYDHLLEMIRELTIKVETLENFISSQKLKV
jgi:hypothetical protein